MVSADLTKINLRPWFGKRQKEARPKRNAGKYTMNMPFLPETLKVDFWDPTFQNLAYCNWFPLISVIPLFPMNATVSTDITITYQVGGYMNPCNIEVSILSLSLSLRALVGLYASDIYRGFNLLLKLFNDSGVPSRGAPNLSSIAHFCGVQD